MHRVAATDLAGQRADIVIIPTAGRTGAGRHHTKALTGVMHVGIAHHALHGHPVKALPTVFDQEVLFVARAADVATGIVIDLIAIIATLNPSLNDLVTAARRNAAV